MKIELDEDGFIELPDEDEIWSWEYPGAEEIKFIIKAIKQLRERVLELEQEKEK